MKMNMNMCVHTTFVLTNVFALYNGDTIDNVENVLNDKVAPERYNKRIRGVVDQTQPVYVNATLMLLAIERFSEVDNSLETMGVLFLSWIDERLKWDPDDYNGTSLIHVYQTDVWRPEASLSNPSKAVTLLGDDRMMLDVQSTGVVGWHAADVFKSTCPVNVESYPWDEQQCDITFVISGYTSPEVKVSGAPNWKVGGNIFDISRCRENGQWLITSTHNRDIDTGIVSQVTFTLRLQRRAVFEVIMVIIPTVTLSILSLLVFFLPIQSGERISYSITVLLSIAVLLSFLGSHLPKNADSMAVICYFISAVLIMSTVSCACSIFSLVLYHGSGSPPYWIKRMVKACSRAPAMDVKQNDDDVVAVERADVNEMTKQYEEIKNGCDIVATSQGQMDIIWSDVSKFFDMICFVGMLLILILFACIYFSNGI